MVYKGMLKINGIWVPTPTTFDFSTEDLEDEAFRTADGLMHRQRVGEKDQAGLCVAGDTGIG